MSEPVESENAEESKIKTKEEEEIRRNYEQASQMKHILQSVTYSNAHYT